MQITVKLFAVLREKAGEPELSLELPQDATVAAGVAAISKQFAAIAPLIEKSAYAVNREYASTDRVLHDGDELALIPAVSGGAP